MSLFGLISWCLDIVTGEASQEHGIEYSREFIQVLWASWLQWKLMYEDNEVVLTKASTQSSLHHPGDAPLERPSKSYTTFWQVFFWWSKQDIFCFFIRQNQSWVTHMFPTQWCSNASGIYCKSLEIKKQEDSSWSFVLFPLTKWFHFATFHCVVMVIMALSTTKSWFVFIAKSILMNKIILIMIIVIITVHQLKQKDCSL